MQKAKSKVITVAAHAASLIARRFQSVETEAQRIFSETNRSRVARAVMDNSGLHVVISDGKSTIEVRDGAVAVSVNNQPQE